MKKLRKTTLLFITLLLSWFCLHAQFIGPAPLVVPGDNYAFAYSLDGTVGGITPFGLYLNAIGPVPGFEFRGFEGSKLLNIQSVASGNRVPGDITFGSTGSLIVNPNRYAFRFSVTKNYGLFFNATGSAFEFKTADASSIFSIEANTGDLKSPGRLEILGNAGVGIPPNTDTKLRVHQDFGQQAASFTLDGSCGPPFCSEAIVLNAEYTGPEIFHHVIGLKVKSNSTDNFGYGVYSEGGYTGLYGQVMDIGSVNGYFSVNAYYGVQGISISNANAKNHTHYGVFGNAQGGDTSNLNFSIYGNVSTGPFVGPAKSYAGYFNGNVAITGVVSFPSDANLKTDVKNVKDAVGIIGSLNAYTYEFDQANYSFMNLPRGKQFGLIAQEVGEVLPELVIQNSHPASDPKMENVEQHGRVDYQSVNYIGLIPVMIEAINEQSQTIKDLEDKLEALQSSLETGSTLKQRIIQDKVKTEKAWLGQNIPNPFDATTVIQYVVPENAGQAYIKVLNLEGKELTTFKLKSGAGHVSLDRPGIAEGSYIYMLVVDGNLIATKQMILNR